MAEYHYKAIDNEGNPVSGTIAAAGASQAMEALTGKGFFVTEVDTSAKKERKSVSKTDKPPLIPIVSSKVFVMTVRRLSTLVAADIPLVKCLHAVSKQVRPGPFRDILEKVCDDVKQGQSLSKALGKYPHVFPVLMVSMVRVGEVGGILSPVLDQLADFMERDRNIRGEVKAAMAYPAFILTFACLVVIFLLSTVVPKLAQMFESMSASLPLPTKILMSISGLFTEYGVWMVGAVVILGIFLFQFLRSPTGRAFIDSAWLRIPLIGSLAAKTSIARFTRSLGALVRGGVPVMEALDVVREIVNNEEMTRSIERVKERLRKGDSMAGGLSREKIFPEMVEHMVAAGEESGKLDEMLLRIADVYEVEVRNAISVALGLFSPLMILMVAAIVAFIAMAMLMPIFQINQLVQ